MNRQWMEPRSPRTGERTLELVKQKLKAGASRDNIRQCCATCRAALKKLDMRKVEALIKNQGNRPNKTGLTSSMSITTRGFFGS